MTATLTSTLPVHLCTSSCEVQRVLALADQYAVADLGKCTWPGVWQLLLLRQRQLQTYVTIQPNGDCPCGEHQQVDWEGWAPAEGRPHRDWPARNMRFKGTTGLRAISCCIRQRKHKLSCMALHSLRKITFTKHMHVRQGMMVACRPYDMLHASCTVSPSTTL